MDQIKPKRRKEKTNYLSQIVVVTLLLLVLGLFANIIFHSYLLSNQIKSLQFLRIELKDDANIDQIKAQLQQNKIIREVEFISKDKGLESLKENVSSNPTELLDKNPLPNLINAYVKAESTPLAIDNELDNIRLIEGIASVDYKKSTAKLLDATISKVSIVMLILIALLLIISIFIIDSTVRLAFFSKRMTIRSMQLIGATKGFIRRPYLVRALINGLVSGLLATLAIAAMYSAIEYNYPALNLLNEIQMIALIQGILILVGVLFTVGSTYLSVSKYLRMKLDDLY